MDLLSDLLADVRIRDAVFVRTRLGSGASLRVDDAQQPCFHLITQGRAWLHPPGGAEPVALNAGDVAFVPQGHSHRVSTTPTASASGQVADLLRHWREPMDHGLAVLALGEAGAGRPPMAGTISGCMRIDGVTPAWLWGGLPPWLTLQWGQGGMPSWLVIGLAYLEQELGRERLARQAVIDRLGDVLFIQSLRSYLDGKTATPAGWLLGLKDAMVSRVLGAIHRDPARQWQLTDLARVGCVSRSVLAERFTQLLGVPPLAYLTQHRMNLAARQLLRSALPVADVARAVGYQSPAAFAQAFRRAFGCSPRDYRTAMAADEGAGVRSRSRPPSADEAR